MNKRCMALWLSLILALAGCARPAPAPEAPGEAAEAPAGTPAPAAAPEAEAQPEGKTVMRIGGLKGPTSIGMVKVMEDGGAGTAANQYEFTIAGSADELTPKLIQGELDMAAIPVNLASVLYNNTGGRIAILAVNTLGVVYIVERGDTVQSLSDLAGKTVYATGKGSTPEYSLRYILSQNGIDPDGDLTIEWKSEPAEVVALLSGGDGVAMLPQPYVTVAQGAVEGLRVAVDLSGEWDRLDNGSAMVTGAMAARREFLERNPEAVEAFLSEYAASVEYVNSNVAEAARLVEKYGIVKAEVAEKAIPYCNIVCVRGSDMREMAGGYLETLYGQNPKAVGGALPGGDFYYGG